MVRGILITILFLLFLQSLRAQTLTHLLGAGNLAQDSVVIAARLDQAGSFAVKYATNPSLTDSTVTGTVAVVSGDDFTGRITLSGLTSNTDYWYQIIVGGSDQLASPAKFKTFPAGSTDVKLAAVSCVPDYDNQTAFSSIASHGYNAMIALGDTPYIDVFTLSGQRSGYKEWYDSITITPELAIEYIYDDHDYGGNNEDGAAIGKANTLQAHREYHPRKEYADTLGIFFRQRVNDCIDIFYLDQRYFRTDINNQISYDTTLTISGSTFTCPSCSSSNDAYDYLTAGSTYRRIIDYDGATKTATLDAAISYSGAVTIDNVSFVAKNTYRGNVDQIRWLIDSVNASTAEWKVIACGSNFNETINRTTDPAPDAWGSWDAAEVNAEQNYLKQELTANNIIFLTGDMHWACLGKTTYYELMTSSTDEFYNGNNWLRFAEGTWDRDWGFHNYGEIIVRDNCEYLELGLRKINGELLGRVALRSNATNRPLKVLKP